jgi:hypothetical protein
MNKTLDKLATISYKYYILDAGWSSLVARRAHNPKVVGSNPAPATNFLVNLDKNNATYIEWFFLA